jgi:membrane protease YdiL (CAAX protease family)
MIFLIIFTVYWLPFFLGGIIGAPFFYLGSGVANVINGVVICFFSILIMVLLRQFFDRPTIKDYGLSGEKLGSNLFLAFKLVFIIWAVEFIVVYIAEFIGISFEGGPQQIDIFFIISAVIIAPIFEEVVYRMNASTLLARRLPIIWVAGITGTWFILKHLPMWHYDSDFGLAALAVFAPVDVVIWIVVTYYFLKRKCIWIPVIIHVVNNGAIAAFSYVPEQTVDYIDIIFAGIGILFIFIFAVPRLYKIISSKLATGGFRITKKTYYHMQISFGMTALLLLTSEAIVYLSFYDPSGGAFPIGIAICGVLGLIFLVLCIITIVYVYVNKNIYYVDT